MKDLFDKTYFYLAGVLFSISMGMMSAVMYAIYESWR